MPRHSRYWNAQLTQSTLDVALRAIEYFVQMSPLTKIEKRRTTLALQALWGIRNSDSEFDQDGYDMPVLFDNKKEVNWKSILDGMLAKERPNVVAMRLGISETAMDLLRSGMFVPSVAMQKRMLDLNKVRNG